MKSTSQLRRLWLIALTLVSATVSAIAEVELFAESTSFLVNTSTPRVDTDGDGMPDSYENSAGLNAVVNDANGDVDGDGLTNIQEYNGGTNPLTPDVPQTAQGVSALFTISTRVLITDTDGDGMPDDWEFAQGLNPLVNDANDDDDGDGLTNIAEYNAGTHPRSNDSPVASTGISALFTANTAIYPYSLTIDTDGDELPDWWEQRYGLNPLVNDANGDADGDGISNLAEFLQGRNPIVNESVTEVAALSAAFTLNTLIPRLDSDSDGIPDAWENANGLDPLRNDTNEDPDGDGRTNLEEYNAGTNPQVDDWRGPSSAFSLLFVANTGGFNGSQTADRDGDGMPDWWEIQYGLNPDVNDATVDADGDGVSNRDEYNSGSNPIVQDYPAIVGISGVFLVDTGGRSFDSDGDGLPDWWEKLYFNDPRAAVTTTDTDVDGHSNREEYISGSNPLDAQSVFKIIGIQAVQTTNGATVTIRWASFDGTTYSIWSATLAQGPYTMIATNIVATPPLNVSTNSATGSNAFFRIGVAR